MKKILLVIAALVLIGGGVWLWMSQDEPASEQSQTTSEATGNSQTNEQSSTVEVTTQNGQVDLTIEGFAFSTQTLRVSKGTRVTWTNQDSAEHTVTSDSVSPKQGLNSPMLGKGASYSFTFDEVGVYNYHCTPHPTMIASVEVVE